MSDYLKCDWCGKSYEKSDGAKFLSGASLGFSNLGKKYCSKSCESAAEEAKNGPKSSSSANFATGANAQPIIVKKGPSADEIIAEAQAEKIEYELEKQKKQDNSLKPWMFENNFKSTNKINSITYPNDVEDIEKTIEKIIKTGVEKIKITVEEHEMGIGEVQVGDKSFLKPYHEEFEFVEACFEKAQEGIKKLKRKDDSEHPKLKVILNDIEDEFSNLKENWFPKLVEKREKKKKKNLIVVGVMLLLVVAFFTWASLR
jgi:hypothetical protein